MKCFYYSFSLTPASKKQFSKENKHRKFLLQSSDIIEIVDHLFHCKTLLRKLI